MTRQKIDRSMIYWVEDWFLNCMDNWLDGFMARWIGGLMDTSLVD